MGMGVPLHLLSPLQQQQLQLGRELLQGHKCLLVTRPWKGAGGEQAEDTLVSSWEELAQPPEGARPQFSVELPSVV